MSDPRISAVGELLGGAPDHLVERSAAARAEAQGVTLEEVLAAWTGGVEISMAAAPAAAAPAEAIAAPAPPTAPSPEALPPAMTPPAEQAPVAAMEAVEVEEEEPVEPAPLADRVRLGVKVGAALGAALALLSIVVQAPLLLTRLSQTTIAGGPAVEVTWTSVAATAAIWAVVGAIVTLAARGLGRFRSRSYDTATTAVGSVLSGGFIGLVLGAGLGGVLFSTAEESLSGTKLVAIGPGMILGVLAAAVVLGAVIGGIGQAMAQPTALSGAEAEDADTVKRRLSDALALPIAAGLVILVIVVSFGSLLLRFASFAPLIAILVSIGTLGFAALMASRPNLRVTRGEVLLAAAGVGVVLLMIALVAGALPGEESDGEEPEDHAIVYGVANL